jgi:hypothetical protein
MFNRVGRITRAIMVANDEEQTRTMCPRGNIKTLPDRVACYPVGLFGKNQVGAGLGYHVHVVHPMMATNVLHNGALYSPVHAIDGCCKSRHLLWFLYRFSGPRNLAAHYSPSSAGVFSPKVSELGPVVCEPQELNIVTLQGLPGRITNGQFVEEAVVGDPLVAHAARVTQ